MGCHSSSFIFKAQIIVDLHGYKRNKSKLHLRSTDTVNDVLVRIRKSLQAKYN